MKLYSMYLLIINTYLPFSAPEDVKPDIIDAAKQGKCKVLQLFLII